MDHGCHGAARVMLRYRRSANRERAGRRSKFLCSARGNASQTLAPQNFACPPVPVCGSVYVKFHVRGDREGFEIKNATYTSEEPTLLGRCLRLTTHHATKTYGGVEVYLHSFLTSTVYGSEYFSGKTAQNK